MSRILHDARLAWRSLSRGRAVTAFAVLAFALGIGITTAVFSIFYGVLIRPLPFPEPGRIVLVYDTQPACATCPASFEKHVEWKTRNTVLSAIGGSTSELGVITGLGDPERVNLSRATAGLAAVFGVQPAIGRWFGEAEDTPGGPKVVVLSDGYWRRKFGAAATVLGQTLTIEGQPHEVIGVMPASFTHRRAEIFLPVARAYTAGNRGSHFLLTYGRLKPGVTPEQAQKEMVALGASLAKEFGHNHGIDVQPYYQAVVGGVAMQLRVLMGAVTLVLLIACANVANLLLASGLARRRELAVRTALGATRWDLARQLTIESVVLAVAGGALGMVLAQWAVRTFVRLADTILPRATAIQMDGTVVAFAAALSLVTGVVCGLWPVVRLNARTLGRDVTQGGLRTGATAESRRFGNGLVIAEIAIAFSLLVGAGLLVKNLIGLESQEMGFRTERIIAFDLSVTGARYTGSERVKTFYRELLPRLAAIGGVARTGVTSHLPMYQFGWNSEVTLEGGNPWPANAAPLVEHQWIGGDYFETMGIPLKRGRLFTSDDRSGAKRVTVISERTAAKFWPGQDPLGRRFSRGDPNNPPYEVVGVVADTLQFGLTRTSPYAMYIPIEQESFGALTVVIRSVGEDPTTVITAARDVVRSLDPLLPLARVQTMEEVVARSVNQPRLISSMTSLFGGLAGILAAVGVYGVMAYNVRRERREFGIRLALGADPPALRRLVIRRGLMLGGLGVALGAGLAVLLTRLMDAMLTKVTPTDPLVFTLAGISLIAVTILAGYLPARQASRTDPMVVLRAE
jgi:putative ABC transport system permease protein